MTSDSTPAFEIEKEALKTEIETGIQSGVDHLEAKTAKRKDADKYHNTRHLLKQYRKVAYAIQISEADMNVRMEMEHGTRLSTLEVNAELAGVDLSGSKLEGYARTVIRSKNMLQIIDNALNTVRMDPDHGELMYQVLYLTYFSKKKPANREVILVSHKTDLLFVRNKLHNIVSCTIQSGADFSQHFSADIFITTKLIHCVFCEPCSFLQISFLHISIKQNVPEFFIAYSHHIIPFSRPASKY